MYSSFFLAFCAEHAAAEQPRPMVGRRPQESAPKVGLVAGMVGQFAAPGVEIHRAALPVARRCRQACRLHVAVRCGRSV